MALLITGGTVIDPGTGRRGALDVLLADGRVAEVAEPKRITVPAERLDASGCWVVPGLIDMHVHLREPGYEYKETIATGTAAAVAGGFTAVACMANTNPVNDSGAVTQYVLERAQAAGLARVYPIGALSVGLRGERLAEVGGVMHEGPTSFRLGLKGVAAAAEEVMVARDIALLERAGGRLHIAHVSTAGSVGLIRSAKARGLPVTAEVTPHHFTLTDEAVGMYDSNAKMNPPLRSAADVRAVIGGLRDGVIDVIASDHAPHHRDEKEVEFEAAAHGIIGLETTLPLALRLTREAGIPEEAVIRAMTVNPARILGVPGGSLAPGNVADITVIDPERPWRVELDQLRSKSRNTPFGGWEMTGAAVATIVGGRVVWRLDGAHTPARKKRSAKR